ncbi:MAG: PEGA domain-containing protein [Calditrichota bacterium]
MKKDFRNRIPIMLLLFFLLLAGLPGNAQEIQGIPETQATQDTQESQESQKPQGKETLAILDFDGLGISQQDAQLLTNRLRTILVQSGAYNVIERGQMEDILNEQNFQLSGCTSQECAVQVGQLLGAKWMMTGSIGKIGQTFTVDLRIINVETSEIDRTASYDIRGEIDQMLTEGMVEVARRITGASVPAPPSHPQQQPQPKPVETPKTGTINLTSLPGGARVFINGIERGATPITGAELPAGQEVEVRFSLDGYETYTTKVPIAEGGNPPVEATLNPLRNMVTVETRPRRAMVSIDSETVGKTPLQSLPYRVGRHTIEIKKAGYRPQLEQFRVEADSPTLLNIRLESKPRGVAFLLSMFVPGAGQFYRGRPLGGLLFMAGTAAAGYFSYDAHMHFQDSKTQYQNLLDQYNQETDYQTAQKLREEIQSIFNDLQSQNDSQNHLLGILGGVYGLNLLTVIF